jgi:hypothetical protein
MPEPRSLFIAILALFHTAGFSAGLDDAPEFVAARQALSDGLPGVAAVKAERLLKQKGWTRVETRQLATFAAEAWARGEDAERVLALAEAHDLNDEVFWRAQALALKGAFAAARKVITEDDQSPRQPRTRLLLAQIFTALGENTAARAEIAPLLAVLDEPLRPQAARLQTELDLSDGKPAASLADASQDAAARYLRARALLQQGQSAAAGQLLETMPDAAGGGERVRHASILLQAEILLQQRQFTDAHEHLLKFLDTTVDTGLWTEAFDLLDHAHQRLQEPRELPEAVLRWVSSGNTAQQQPEPSLALVKATGELRGHALFILAKWLASTGRGMEAVSLLEAMLQMQQAHPRRADALRLAMELHAAQGADERALTLADAWRQLSGGASAKVDFTAGSLLFRRGDHLQALQLFQNAANIATTLTDRRRALFNAAVTAVSAGNFTLYQSLLGQLEVVTSAAGAGQGADDSAATLELEKALFAASKRQPDAEPALRAFIRAHPGHPRFADACVALAEWLLMAVPPRIQDARITLDATTAATALSESQMQRIDLTRLWLHDAAGNLKELIAEGAAFLTAWPKSAFVPEVRMKIAGAHYRLEDFASARTEFEIIARDYPDTANADTALYFAAMSASSVMSAEGRVRALATWEDLAQKGGPLAVAARRQQALSERAQGRLTEALAALDKLLALKTLDVEQRRLTSCEKAEVLLLLGKTEPERLAAAISLLDAFLADHSLPFFWKARAGFTLATAHHDAKRDTEALEACYNVLRAADITPPSSPADYVWFAKTGFFGIDLLEAAHQWEAAARLAEQVAQRRGDREREARERATKIRLEHFLWDGPSPTPPKVLKLKDEPEARPDEPGKPAPKSTKKSP